MQATGTFSVKSFVPTEVVPDPPISTGVPVGVMLMEKVFEGEVAGRAATLFTAAFDPATETGTYLAMESFEGSLNGRAGTFAFGHSATTTGTDRSSQFFIIVPGSGTGELAGITGAGSLDVDADGTHRIAFDYEIA
ncbi:DUF3224 domain-containing protein [Nocardia sp. NBC_01503]|uniref:DUF3224 domain-containing protein n=1 Tax=Nocardia sp. NBC_01503 TaxID=2975997 RepID=UPI002E7B811D|nr:DUF3224 domain-containing protein [Nocardia sp. NBC_01503]WTL33657.1 DUF3224 domain-containing protein [Nocardia sp. NBC_01503]